jgi:hypothetical protein
MRHSIVVSIVSASRHAVVTSMLHVPHSHQGQAIVPLLFRVVAIASALVCVVGMAMQLDDPFRNPSCTQEDSSRRTSVSKACVRHAGGLSRTLCTPISSRAAMQQRWQWDGALSQQHSFVTGSA